MGVHILGIRGEGLGMPQQLCLLAWLVVTCLRLPGSSSMNPFQFLFIRLPWVSGDPFCWACAGSPLKWMKQAT